MIRLVITRLVVITVLAGLCTGCALFGRGGGSPSHLRTSAPVQDENREEELRALIRDVLNDELNASSMASARLVEKRPYYYKEYVDYPSGIDDFEITTVASGLKSTPYIANIKLDKARHSTLLSKNRKEAMQDEEFYSSSGYETRTFELRHGRWRETGSVYIAQEGETVPRRIRTRDEGGLPEERTGLRRLLFWRND